jgi:DHA1 family bicyclomycin/chloramphenicol resistance-like MFS transporter
MANGLALFASTIYLPSLPLIALDLKVSAASVQDTVALSFLGMGLSNLIYGPLSDVYGRRSMMLFGFGIFCLFSLGCAFAGDIYFLTLFRFLSGCGAGVALGLVMTMINDLYAGIKAAQIMARMTFVLVLAPAFAPLCGGYLAVLLGWRSIFIMSFILGVGVWLLMWLMLQETAPLPLKRSFSFAHTMKNYGRALKHRPFMGYVFSQGALFCGLWAYQTVAPFILINHLGVPTERYGYYSASLSLSHGLGSLIAHRFVQSHGNEFLLRCGFYGALISSVSLALITSWFPMSAVLITMTVAIYTAAIAFVLPPAITQSMEIMAHQRGMASAVLISARMALAFCGSIYGGWVMAESFMPVALCMGGFAVLSLIVLRMAARSPLQLDLNKREV